MSTNRRPADIARRSAKALQARPHDAFRRETFALPREKARKKAREMLRRFPKSAYMTEIESWRELPGDRSERGLMARTFALPFGPLARFAQDEERECSGGETRGRRGLVTAIQSPLVSVA